MSLRDLQSPEMSPVEFRLLRDLIHEHCGIYFRDELRYLVERRLGPRLRVHGLADFDAYHRFLRYDRQRRAELDSAVEALTTNETYFYREPHQLRAFASEILPMVAAARRQERRLRIWSAGCSTGEEAYTIVYQAVHVGKFNFRWIPTQQMDEKLCVPSEVIEYLKAVGDPAGSDPNANTGRY